jgi:hypothetical protein
MQHPTFRSCPTRRRGDTSLHGGRKRTTVRPRTVDITSHRATLFQCAVPVYPITRGTARRQVPINSLHYREHTEPVERSARRRAPAESIEAVILLRTESPCNNRSQALTSGDSARNAAKPCYRGQLPCGGIKRTSPSRPDDVETGGLGGTHHRSLGNGVRRLRNGLGPDAIRQRYRRPCGN